MNGECNLNIEKFHFRLNQMEEICKTTIPRLQMDFAVLWFMYMNLDCRSTRTTPELEVLQSFVRRHWWVQQEISFFREEDLFDTKKLIIYYRYVFESYKEMDLIRVRRQLDF